MGSLARLIERAGYISRTWDMVMAREHKGQSMWEKVNTVNRATAGMDATGADGRLREMLRAQGMTTFEIELLRAEMEQMLEERIEEQGYEAYDHAQDDRGPTGQAMGRPLRALRSKIHGKLPWRAPPWTGPGGVREEMQEEAFYLSKMLANEVLLVRSATTHNRQEATERAEILREMLESGVWDTAIEVQTTHMQIRCISALCKTTPYTRAGAAGPVQYRYYAEWLWKERECDMEEHAQRKREERERRAGKGGAGGEQWPIVKSGATGGRRAWMK